MSKTRIVVTVESSLWLNAKHKLYADECVDSSQLGYDSAIHVGSCWKTRDRRQIKKTENTQIKYNSEKANNAKYNLGSVAFRGVHPRGNDARCVI